MTDDPKVDNEDEQRRKFREALEAKKAHHKQMRAAGRSNKGVSESRNAKQQREFRRKSG